MKQPIKSLSPLRQRMLEGMRIRDLALGTQTAYIQAVKRLAAFLGRSPNTATAEELRLFQLQGADTVIHAWAGSCTR